MKHLVTWYHLEVFKRLVIFTRAILSHHQVYYLNTLTGVKSVYVCTIAISEFAKILPSIPGCIVLVSGDADEDCYFSLFTPLKSLNNFSTHRN